MRLDSANRSFLALMGITVLIGAYLLCGAAGSVLLPLLLLRVSHGGATGLLHGDSPPLLLLFLAVVGVLLALGSRSLLRQTLAAYRLAQRVRGLAVEPPYELLQAAAAAGLGGRVLLLDSPERFSFTYGILTPRVVVSRGLLADTSTRELRAVLEHECYHVRNLDPLKVILVNAASAGVFFLPVLRSLRARYVAGRELAADRRAVAVCGRRPLVGALLKVVRGPEWSELEVAAAIGGPELLDVRVSQLETGQQPRLPRLTLSRTAISLLAAALFVASFLASVSSLGGSAAVRITTGDGLASANLHGVLSCCTPFAGAGLLAYGLLARRASRPLESDRQRDIQSSASGS